jgi:hypothetical protein
VEPSSAITKTRQLFADDGRKGSDSKRSNILYPKGNFSLYSSEFAAGDCLQSRI